MFPLAILPTKFIEGIGSLTPLPGANPLPLVVLPLREALERLWDSDAHFVCYLPFTVDGPDLEDGAFRLRKEILQELRAAGGDVFCPILALDYDLPRHGEWTAPILDAFITLLNNAPSLPQYHYAYTTTHGMRFIYILTTPLIAEDAEAATKQLITQFHTAGITLDQVWDWTRCYRLPLVMRENVTPTWDSAHLWFDDRLDDPPYTPDITPTISTPKPSTANAPHLPPPPTPEEALALLEIPPYHRKTEFAKRAKHLLQGRECFPALFGGQPIGAPGERDRRLLRLVGEAANLLFGEATPQQLYALFLEPVLQLDPDTQTPDWTRKLWYDVDYCWRRQAAAQQQVAEAAQQIVHTQDANLEHMAEGMAKWCKSEDLLDPRSDKAKLFVIAHLIVTTGRGYYLLGHDGWYDSSPLASVNHIPAKLRELGLAGIVPLDAYEGKLKRPVPVQTIITRHMTFVKGIDGSLHTDRCYVQDIDTEGARFIICLFKLRDDLAPTHDPQVRRWMELLVGEDRIWELERWVAWALDFREGPICALSLVGPPSVGKKLFVMGLAECLNTEKVATGLDLVQPFQSALLETCFLVVDEGLPTAPRGTLDVADSFRRLVSGDPTTVNLKFRDPIFVRNPLRIIFTANNMDVLVSLTKHRNLSPDDQAALAQRILHFDVDKRAADWLRGQGGTRFTRGWIRGDAGEPSAYRLAKHFLWLYARRHEYPRDTRLLVEGSRDQTFLTDMRTNSGSAPAVIEALVRMVESREVANMGGLSLESGVYATAAGVVDFARSHNFPDKTSLNVRQVVNVFKGLSKNPAGALISTTMKTVSGTMSRANWWQIDPVCLLREALRTGLPNEKLFAIVTVMAPTDVDAANLVKGQ